jgi:hypothetical protein
VADERRKVVLVDVTHHVEALGRRAHLAGVQIRGPRPAARRDVDRVGDVGADDERVLAAQLQIHAGDPLRAHGRDPAPGRHRARERDAVDALVGHQVGADRSIAGEHVDHAGRQVIQA